MIHKKLKDVDLDNSCQGQEDITVNYMTTSLTAWIHASSKCGEFVAKWVVMSDRSVQFWIWVVQELKFMTVSRCAKFQDCM